MVIDTGKRAAGSGLQEGNARGFEMGASGQSADVVILVVVLMCSLMLGQVLGCHCVSIVISITLENVGGLLGHV
ncbi:hypothetical protein V6N13_019664 [Hibiscus sabdariffa]